jgi:hypothetical protein
MAVALSMLAAVPVADEPDGAKGAVDPGGVDFAVGGSSYGGGGAVMFISPVERARMTAS